mgnify:CR=1 FL=1
MERKTSIFLVILLAIIGCCTIIALLLGRGNESENIHAKIFLFDDNKIKQALEEGKKKEFNEYYDSTYKLTPLDTSNTEVEIRLSTPYSMIMQQSALAWKVSNYIDEIYSGGMESHVDFARKSLEKGGEVIGFNVSYYFNQESASNSLEVKLEQNKKTLKSPVVMWNKTTHNPNSAIGYKLCKQGMFTYNFKTDGELDLSRVVVLRIIYDSSKECVFNVDFNKYK